LTCSCIVGREALNVFSRELVDLRLMKVGALSPPVTASVRLLVASALEDGHGDVVVGIFGVLDGAGGVESIVGVRRHAREDVVVLYQGIEGRSESLELRFRDIMASLLLYKQSDEFGVGELSEIGHFARWNGVVGRRFG
jgi:hypothetical protein